jgi:hypothetical protein
VLFIVRSCEICCSELLLLLRLMESESRVLCSYFYIM